MSFHAPPELESKRYAGRISNTVTSTVVFAGNMDRTGDVWLKVYGRRYGNNRRQWRSPKLRRRVAPRRAESRTLANKVHAFRMVMLRVLLKTPGLHVQGMMPLARDHPSLLVGRCAVTIAAGLETAIVNGAAGRQVCC